MALAGLAAAAAGTAYLDAKYNIAADASMIFNSFWVERKVNQAVAAKRLSLWYPWEAQVARLGKQDCLWSRGESLNWQQANHHACQYAQFYLSLGLRPGEAVAFYLTNSLEFVLAMLGSWAIGSSAATINHNVTGEGLMHCLKLCDSRVLLVDEDSAVAKAVEELRSRIENELGMRIIRLDAAQRNKIARFEAKRPSDDLRANVQAMDFVMLIFTSGTTGFPKASKFDLARATRGSIGRKALLNLVPSPATRFYNCMPLYHGTGATIALMCLMSGMTLCVGRRFRVSSFWDDIRASQATAFVYVGETARYLLAAPPSARDREHKVTAMFGNGLRPDVWKAFRDRFGIDTIIEFFNSTEGVFGTVNVARGDFLATAVGQHGLLLRLLYNNRIVPARTDPDDNKKLWRSPDPPHFCERMPYDVGGEILVRVPSVKPEDTGFTGYVNNPKATSERFVRDVFKKGDIWYRSGDALRRDADGRWFFLDRLGDTYRWKSENVSTTEVAVAMGDFPGVLEANVYGVLVPGHDGRAGCAAVYIPGGVDASKSFDWKALLEHARRKLPKYAVPIFIRVLNGEIKAGMHNMKLNKVPLREEGVDVRKMSGGDRMLWSPPGSDRYMPFEETDLDGIIGGKSKL